MNKIFLCVVFALTATLANAQAPFSFSRATISIAGDSCSNPSAFTKLYNLTNSTLKFNWRRTFQTGFPSTWTVSTCDNNGCYASNVSTMLDSLPAHDSADITMTVTPTGAIGTGIIKFTVTKFGDTTHIDAYFNVNVARCATGINDLHNAQVNIFPSPFTSNFSIQLNNNELKPKCVEVFNLLGTLVYKQELSLSSFDNLINIQPDNLPRGMYFVTLIDSDRKTILSKRIQKN